MTCMSTSLGFILLSDSLSFALHAQDNELHGKALRSHWLCEKVSESQSECMSKQLSGKKLVDLEHIQTSNRFCVHK